MEIFAVLSGAAEHLSDRLALKVNTYVESPHQLRRRRVLGVLLPHRPRPRDPAVQGARPAAPVQDVDYHAFDLLRRRAVLVIYAGGGSAYTGARCFGWVSSPSYARHAVIDRPLQVSSLRAYRCTTSHSVQHHCHYHRGWVSALIIVVSDQRL